MRQTWLWLLLLPVLGCTGYERPTVRNLDDIGAPSVHVGSDARAVADTPLPAPSDTEGKVVARDADALEIVGKGGALLRLQLGPRTLIDLDGRRVNVWSVPEGAQVRASWDAAAPAPLAEHIEVLELRPSP